MNALLASLCSTEEWRGLDWTGSWLCGGSPLRDPATELLFKQGLPSFRRALLVNWGCGAWTRLLGAEHGQAEAVHSYAEDAELFSVNTRTLPGRLWHPGQALPPEWEGVDLVLVRMWKEMEYNLAFIGALAPLLAEGCRIQFLGHKEDGIRNLEKRLGNWGSVDTLAIGCHSRFISLRWQGLPAGVRVPPPACGLFGNGKMDAGTRLLLEQAGPVQGLSVCDLGCGSGDIAAWALEQGARRVYACDHQALSVDLTRERLGGLVDRCAVACHFIGEDIGETFDLVLTNPPFHLQGQTRFALGQVWLRSAKALLSPGGRVRLVCNEFLDYERFGKDNGMLGRELARRGGFRVYEFSC